MSNLLTEYRSKLQREARSARPGFGWYGAIVKASLPWVMAVVPAILVAALTAAPFWLVLLLWVAPMAAWVFVQITMLAEIVKTRKGRH